MRLLRSKTVLLVLFALASGSMALMMANLFRQRGPALQVDEDEKTVVLQDRSGSEPPTQSAEVAFEISNAGTEDLVLGRVTTSCGCAIASLPSRVIAPGGTSSLRVAVTGFPVGSRDVVIRIPSNSILASETVLRVRVQADSSPPYVLHWTNAVNFGTLEDLPAVREFALLVLESQNVPPVEPELVCKEIDSVEISLIGSEETRLGESLVQRKYLFKAQLKDAPPPGAFHASFVIDEGTKVRGSSRVHIHAIGRVPDPVSLVPTAVLLDTDQIEGRPQVTVSLAVRRLDSRVSLQLPPESEELITVTEIGSPHESMQYASCFLVKATPALLAEPARTYIELYLKTGAEQSTLRVPVLVKAAGGKSHGSATP